MSIPCLTHTLGDVLSRHLCLNKSRIETLVVIIVGLVSARTVNLSHIACHFSSSAKHASNYRRLQRFFQHVRLDNDWVALMLVRLLNQRRPWLLALDRTHWKVVSSDINILMLALVARRFRVPLMWVMLDKPGSSNTDERIALMQRYLAVFGAQSIQLLLADREFIGHGWFDFLNKNNIAFAIRIKKSMHLMQPDGTKWSFKTLLRKRRSTKIIRTWSGWLPGMKTTPQNLMSFAARRIKNGEWLIIASNREPKNALRQYRKRWAIECMFGDTKTRGFNIEDTRITNLEKLDLWLAIIALAMSWTYRCATQTMGFSAIRKKTHGYREKSWFRTGLDQLRRWIIHQPEKAAQIWIKLWPKKKSTLKMVGVV
tara:strand:- start:5 stop:1114 length:1110 start_codon:yes stop_codon:yes gene_type:complete